MTVVTKSHADEICKQGTGAECCKYLMGGPEGLACAKSPGNESLRAILAIKTDMLAQGDNCDGWQSQAIWDDLREQLESSMTANAELRKREFLANSYIGAFPLLEGHMKFCEFLLGAAQEHIAGLEDALRLVLLFHRGGWTDIDQQQWARITGAETATTKAMCDHIRKVLGE